ncbi:hypothetical protein SCHPADRAFT_500502 [Schizopora paradoxa]|uniref:Uncharacterized protein n=1 Tax=Schizopora paradoxa TaxID=27342 RepID=A0A0H2RMY1_9AGAM|nr:hypothetical protein SCHPADRAFT_500502 [Schizopora paradoxa]
MALDPLSPTSSSLFQDFIPMELDVMSFPAPLIQDALQQESPDDDDSDDSNSDFEDESDDEFSDVPSPLRPRPETQSPPTSPLEEYGMFIDYSECDDLPEADEELPEQATFIVDPPAPSPEFENGAMDCASDLSGVFEDESEDESTQLAEAGNEELTTPLSDRHIIHPHSRRVAVHASTPPVASSSVAHALPEVTPTDDERLTESEPEPEDDDADSDYSPAIASGHSSRRAARKNRAPARKAPKPLAAASSEDQDSPPLCVKIVISANVAGKKRSKSVSQPKSAKRRKLTDTTSSVVNNPDAAQAPRRARKATTSPASNGKQPSRPVTSSVKRVRDFAYAFDIDSAYRKVKMSEIEDVRKCILEPKFTGDRTEDRYTYLTAEQWAINVEKFQKIMMKKDGIRKKVTDNWVRRFIRIIRINWTDLRLFVGWKSQQNRMPGMSIFVLPFISFSE